MEPAASTGGRPLSRPLRAAALALLLALSSCFGGGEVDVPQANATAGPFEMVLAITGELEAVNSVFITAPDLGRTIKVTSIVDEGVRVEKDQVLVEFDRNELEVELEDEEAKLEVATTKIAQHRAQMEVKLADLGDAMFRSELDLERAKMRVSDSETIPRVEREGAKLDVKESQVAVERARKALEAARLEGEAELELLQIEARRAQARVDKVSDRLDKTVIKAPAAGLVIKQDIWHGGKRGPVQEGDSVWRGSQILELPDLSQMQVIAWVHEVDAGLVQEGQQVSVVIDAHPEPPHRGQVQRVAEVAVERDDDSGVKHLKVTVSLERVDEVMKPGMTVRAELLVDRQEDVISIPQEGVFYDEQESFVFVPGLGGWKRAAVTLGATNDTHVVVTAGLEAGATVALADPELWSTGQRAPAASGNGPGS